MAEVEIPFYERFTEDMSLGVKDLTARFRRYGAPGDTFKWGGETYMIMGQWKAPLGDHWANWRREGFKSEREFREFWGWMHPIRHRDTDVVYVHQFKRATVA